MLIRKFEYWQKYRLEINAAFFALKRLNKIHTMKQMASTNEYADYVSE